MTLIFLLYLLISVTTHYVYSMEKVKELSKIFKLKKNHPNTLSEEEFEQIKTQLPQPLNTFLNDFQTWSIKDKKAISIVSKFNIFIKNLPAEKTKPYESNLGHWIDSQIRNSKERAAFLRCIKHLQSQQENPSKT